MMENLDVESLVELLVGLTSSEASALVDLVNSNIIRLLELHDEAGIAIVKPTKLQELIALENEMKRLGLSHRDLRTFIDGQEQKLIASRALINRISIETIEFLEHFSGLQSLLLLIRRHDYFDAGHKLQCRMMVNVSALQRCMPFAEAESNMLIQLLRHVVNVRRLYRDLKWPDSIGTIKKLDFCVMELGERIRISVNDELQANRHEVRQLEHDDDKVIDVLDIKTEEDTTMEDAVSNKGEVEEQGRRVGKTVSTSPSPQQDSLQAAVSISASPLAALFAERAARFEGSEREQRLEDRAEARAKAEARKAAIAADPTKAQQRKWAEEVKVQKNREKIQRNYVLAQIEDDKRARMERIQQERLRLGLIEEADGNVFQNQSHVLAEIEAERRARMEPVRNEQEGLELADEGEGGEFEE